MDITYNGQSSPSNMLTFTDVPNILSVTEYSTGSKASFNFFWEGNLQTSVTADSQYYITFLGETVSNVMNPQMAKNKRFYISSDEDSTAASFARALRNCGGIAADFNIIQSGPDVYLLAKTFGQKWSNTPNYIQRNIPNDKLSTFGTDGNAYSVLYNAKIGVDVYSGETSDRNNYVTTLEKNFYGNECAFDVSPVLTTFSQYGQTIPYYFVLNLFREDGEWQYMGTVSGNTAIGYQANQADKFKYASGTQMLLNKRRGNDGIMTLYTYSSFIPYSVLCGADTGGYNITVSCKDSANNEIYNSSSTGRRVSSNYILDGGISIPQNIFNNAYYVDITLGVDTTRFNVIKPLKATEYYQRILWRNEYGGISFFDFTGSKSESDSVDIETYEKNVFDYYTTGEYERKKIYSNDYKKTVTLTSHLMEEDGKWIFNSLMRSKKVWTVVNNKTYYIIPKSIEVTEDQSYNNIFTAKLQYEYSDI